jgi:hypothetical protein
MKLALKPNLIRDISKHLPATANKNGILNSERLVYLLVDLNLCGERSGDESLMFSCKIFGNNQSYRY